MTTRPIDYLKQREYALAAMILQIEAKSARLNAARRQRAAALQRIRAELARAILNGGPAGPDHDDCT